MAFVSPGLSYAGRRLPGLVLPPLMTYGALHLIEKHEVASVPKWAFIGLIAIAKPVHYVASLYLQRIRNWFKARRLGARLAPHIKEPWYSFVGLSLIPQMIESFNHGYVCECCTLQNVASAANTRLS
jgi:hypothetical protein